MPKKRSNGEGSLHKRPNGTWEWQIMLGYQPDGRRRVKSFYGKTQKEAKEKGKKYLEQLESEPELREDMGFSEWADIWYEGMEDQLTPTTYDNYRYTLRILKDHFKETPLKSIKALTIERFLRQMASEGRSKSYVTKFRGMLFQIMKKAEANDLIRKNPVALADKTRMKTGESTKDAFTAREIERMFQRLPHDRLGDSIRLMLGTGMRTQELMALEPRHIEPDGSVIHVRQAIKQVRGVPTVGEPKTRNSYRDIPVPEAVRPSAMALRDTNEKYIWHGVNTELTNPCNFRRQFKKALEEVGEVRLLSPHCCRHTYVSQLQAVGVEFETIKSMSGHSDLEMTEHYLHVQQEVKLSAAAKLNSLFPTESSAQ